MGKPPCAGSTRLSRIRPRGPSPPYNCRWPGRLDAGNLPVRLAARPAIVNAADDAADEQHDPEQPELRERRAANDQRRPGRARRIDRRIGDRNAHEVNQRQAKADRQWGEAGRRLAVRRAHDDEQEQHGHYDFGQQRRHADRSGPANAPHSRWSQIPCRDRSPVRPWRWRKAAAPRRWRRRAGR